MRAKIRTYVLNGTALTRRPLVLPPGRTVRIVRVDDASLRESPTKQAEGAASRKKRADRREDSEPTIASVVFTSSSVLPAPVDS